MRTHKLLTPLFIAILSFSLSHAQGLGVEGTIGSAYPIRKPYNIVGSASVRAFYELYSGWQIGLNIGHHFVELYRDEPFLANENRTIRSFMITAYNNNAPYASKWKHGMLAGLGLVHSNIYYVDDKLLFGGQLGYHFSWQSDIGIYLKTEFGMQTTLFPLSNNRFILLFASVGTGYFLEF